MCVFPRNIVESGSRAWRGAVSASPGSEAGTNRKGNLQQDPAGEDSELVPLRGAPGVKEEGEPGCQPVEDASLSLAQQDCTLGPSSWVCRRPPPPASLLVAAWHPSLACHSAARPWILPLAAAQGLGVTNLCPRA